MSSEEWEEYFDTLQKEFKTLQTRIVVATETERPMLVAKGIALSDRMLEAMNDCRDQRNRMKAG